MLRRPYQRHTYATRARDIMVSWPDPLKFLKILVVVDKGGNQILVRANAPVKRLVLAVPNEDDGEDADWQDNRIDLVPQETVIVGVTGLRRGSIAVRWLCDWETEPKAEVLVIGGAFRLWFAREAAVGCCESIPL